MLRLASFSRWRGKDVLRTLAIVVVVAIVSYSYGAFSFAYRTFPIHWLGGVKRIALPDRGSREPTRPVVSDGAGRQEVDCASIREDAAILLIMGQSNAANSGETRYRTQHDVINYNWVDGKCYHAEDPLLGTDGDGGTIWTRLGDDLIESGSYKQVVLVDIAVSGTRIRMWAGGEGPTRHAVETASALKRLGRRFTHVLWHQGESDWETPRDIYVRLFETMVRYLRSNGIDAPVFVAQTTLCLGRHAPDVMQAQIELPTRMENVFGGANADSIDRLRDRQDDLCHFKDSGLAQLAHLWHEALIGPRHVAVGAYPQP
jgi:Carbohydrate esterase, sialic acid-specific acetylesterase